MNQIVPLTPDHVQSCFQLGSSLREWFGDEDGPREMHDALARGPGYIAICDRRIQGFVTYEARFAETWEITWLAVAEERHRQGIGRMLVDTVVREMRIAAAQMLLVKTLADTHPSPEYARTRAFYRALGFSRIAVIPDFWNSDNPCLFLVRPV